MPLGDLEVGAGEGGSNAAVVKVHSVSHTPEELSAQPGQKAKERWWAARVRTCA